MDDKGPIVEKAHLVAEKPYKLLSEAPFTVMKTSYAFWLHNNNQVTALNPTGGKIKPKIARDRDGKFEIYEDGAWVETDKGQYFFEQKDKQGEPVLKANGQPQKGFYFDTYYEYPVEFKNDVEVEAWSKENKCMQVETTRKARLRVKTSLNKRIQNYLTDPRNKDTFMEITYDKTAMPADMYGIRFSA